MRVGCKGCPYPDFQHFYNYYGRDDYAHHWVESAFAGAKTDFVSGNADFSRLGLVGRTEAIKKGTAYLNIFMYVIRELEDAMDDCERGCINCNDSPVHAWDEGVVSIIAAQISHHSFPSTTLNTSLTIVSIVH